MNINYNFTYHAGFDIISRRSVSDEYYAVSMLCVIIVKIQIPILNFDEVSQLFMRCTVSCIQVEDAKLIDTHCNWYGLLLRIGLHGG